MHDNECRKHVVYHSILDYRLEIVDVVQSVLVVDLFRPISSQANLRYQYAVLLPYCISLFLYESRVGNFFVILRKIDLSK
jgi:hypothetical protein